MMCIVKVFVLLTFCFVIAQPVLSASEHHLIHCPPTDETCSNDTLGYDAIGQLHKHIDDDQNGNLDRDESDEFFRDELKYDDGFDRQVTFHGSDDLISVYDLWKLWVHSAVYNWTVDDVIVWLNDDVELPQYTETFRVNIVDGHVLPRLAANSQYLSSILGIKNGVHRQKMAVKATDLVLFGPPKRPHNWIKDLIVLFSMCVAIAGCWYAHIQRKYSQKHITKMMRDLDNLKVAESNFNNLQQKLDDAHKEKHTVAEEKENLENKLRTEIETAKHEAERLRIARETTAEEIASLKLAEDELVQVRMALMEAERQLEERHNAPLAELQQWLQLTYELESRHYELKKEAAEKQLTLARDMCEKIRRKRGAFLGSFRIAHNSSLDETDQKIMNARTALESVKIDLQERADRWKQVEKICGFNIELNPGVQYLESLLRGPGHLLNTSTQTMSARGMGMTPLDVDGADEDQPPGAFTSSVAFYSQSLGPPLSPICLTPGGSTLSLPSDIRRSPRPRAPGLQRTATAPHTLPNLMRAGMQLSMLGMQFDPRFGGVPGGEGLRHRPGGSTTLAAALGGSQSSLHTLHTRSSRPVLSPTSQQTDSDNVSDSEDVAGPLYNGGATSRVEFGLWEKTAPTVSTSNSGDNNHGNNNVIFSKSTSVDAGMTRHQVTRPKTLMTALSDSQIKTPSAIVGPGGRVGTPTLEEENSSPESTDSTPDKLKKKRKKLINPFKKS